EYHDIIKKDLIKLSKVNQDNEEYEILKVKELTKNELIIYKDMLLINFLETILKISDNYITSYFNKSVYIAPIRATAERYYRLRNLSIEEVDSSGRNLVDFLYNLDNRKFQQFQEWTNEFLGFQVEKDGIGNDEINKGYVSIYIRKNGDQNRYNLSDTGFGYSQILPIVTQLWFIAYNARKKWYFLKSPTTIIIEQPELHLHPKLQSKLISAICSLANDQFRFIIETHSETIINKIGDLIYKKKIGNEDVNIQIFSKKNEKMETIVESSSYD
ncbi:AAA family ATPase, partial [Streptococcus mitis]|uniref:AAA family ATPase n=1 Tax=Streptococcus mitis TaxID=28037 RepID=UPI001431B5D0